MVIYEVIMLHVMMIIHKVRCYMWPWW